jgi:long-chain acyl-CoA synthetase
MTGRLASLLYDWLLHSGAELVELPSRSFTGPEILELAAQGADALQASGVEADEPVHVAISNRPADIAGFLAVWSVGGVVVPVHRNASVTTRLAVGAATGARLQLDGTSVEDIALTRPQRRELLAGAAFVIFTSGTTGAPKGVVLGHDALAGKLDALDRLLSIRRDDVVLAPLQLIFIFGVWVSLLAVRTGARLVLAPKFTMEATAQALGRDVTVLAAVPSLLRTLLADSPPAAGHLRAILTGGEALAPVLRDRLAGAWPTAGVFDLYGSTETGSCDFVVRPADAALAAGSIGTPTEGVAYRIVHEDGIEAEPGETGELRIETPFRMLGYLDNPSLTEASIVDGGFRTGDLARARPDGRVELVGRSKEIISRGGNKISPLEVENVLCAHGSVAAALCAGVPDARLGEAIHAVVVLRRHAELSAGDLRAWAAERIERYKLPDVIIFMDALPLGETGKASRAALRAMSIAG